MLFCKKELIEAFTIVLNDIKLPTVNCTKFLGVWIDHKLRWNEHVHKIILKKKCNMNLLKCRKNFLNEHAKKMCIMRTFKATFHIVFLCGEIQQILVS